MDSLCSSFLVTSPCGMISSLSTHWRSWLWTNSSIATSWWLYSTNPTPSSQWRNAKRWGSLFILLPILLSKLALVEVMIYYFNVSICTTRWQHASPSPGSKTWTQDHLCLSWRASVAICCRPDTLFAKTALILIRRGNMCSQSISGHCHLFTGSKCATCLLSAESYTYGLNIWSQICLVLLPMKFLCLLVYKMRALCVYILKAAGPSCCARCMMYRSGQNCWYPSVKGRKSHNGHWTNLKLTKVIINKNVMKIN